MDKSKTILSSSALLAELLAQEPDKFPKEVTFFPVIAPEKAICPYVVYRRAKVSTEAVKTGMSADTAAIEVLCCGSSYAQSVELAEWVRQTLDGTQITSDDGKLRLRSCRLTDAYEGTEAQTFIQAMTFIVKINN